jgi:hypothetical protein
MSLSQINWLVCPSEENSGRSCQQSSVYDDEPAVPLNCSEFNVTSSRAQGIESRSGAIRGGAGASGARTA